MILMFTDAKDMKYRLLGNSGLRVSELALGTMAFGENWGWSSPKEEAQKVYRPLFMQMWRVALVTTKGKGK